MVFLRPHSLQKRRENVRHKCEFIGSLTVSVDGCAGRHLSLRVLSCSKGCVCWEPAVFAPVFMLGRGAEGRKPFRYSSGCPKILEGPKLC